jgi:hypothetical protein
MGQSEKVEGAVPIVPCLVGIGLPKRNHCRLRWMNAQAKASEPLWQHGHAFLGVRFQLAPDDEVIRKANQEASSLHPRPYLLLEPLIQDMMEKYIGQYG